MRTAKRALSIAVLAALSIGAMSACSSPPAAGTTTVDAAAGQPKGELTYWSMWTETEPQAAVLKDSIAAFEKKTGVKVDVQWQGRKVLDQVAAGLAAGTAPDLVDQAYDKLGPVLNSQNALADLSGVWSLKTDDGKVVSDVVNKGYVTDLPTFGGDTGSYLVPYTVSTVSLFYNEKSPYVTSAPASYDDVVKDCAAAKAAGVGCIVSDGDSIWAAEYWFDYLLNRNLGNGAFSKLVTDKTGASWDQPGVRTTAQAIRDFVTQGYMTASYDASQYPAGETGWAQGKGVFYLMGSWVTAETQKAIGPGWVYSGINFPTTTNPSNNALSVIPFGFAVPKAAKNPDAAKAFIAFFSSTDQQGKIAARASNLTALKDGPAPTSLESVATSLSGATARVPFDGEAGDVFAKAFDPAFGDLWLGKSDTDQFIAAAKAKQIDYWKSKG